MFALNYGYLLKLIPKHFFSRREGKIYDDPLFASIERRFWENELESLCSCDGNSGWKSIRLPQNVLIYSVLFLTENGGIIQCSSSWMGCCGEIKSGFISIPFNPAFGRFELSCLNLTGQITSKVLFLCWILFCDKINTDFLLLVSTIFCRLVVLHRFILQCMLLLFSILLGNAFYHNIFEILLLNVFVDIAFLLTNCVYC